MEFLKPAELMLRRLLVAGLSYFVKRNRPIPEDFDYSNRKFLFVRQDRIGDVLVSTPMLHALKETYPNATVDFLLSTNNYFVLENEPLVRKRWLYKKTFRSAFEVLRGIRREGYDFVIDLMDNPSATSTIFCLCAGATWNVGLSKENAYSYDIVVPLLSRKDVHIVERIAMLLTVFNIDPAGRKLRLHYHVQPASRSFAADTFASKEFKEGEVIGINISPGSGTRFWGRERYQELIRWLRENLSGSRIMVLFRPSDADIAQSIVEPFPEVVLSPETRTFDQFAALIQRLRLLVTPDTSAAHLAGAFSVPAVVLYVQSDKELRVWEPYGSRSETVVTEIDDLRTIPVERVTQAIARIIAPAGESPIPSHQATARTIR